MPHVIKEAVGVFDTQETLEAAVFELETRGFDHIQQVVSYLNSQGYEVEVMK